MKLSDVNMEFVKKTAPILKKCRMGGDPEFFISTHRGKVLNADRFFPGKEEPLRIGEHLSRCRLFFDGIQGEMSYAPSTCRETVIARIKAILMEAQRRVKDDHRILLKPSSKIDRAIIENAHPEARIFGCMPDYNAYTRSTNTCEMDASRHPFRYAGGHLHFGMSASAEKDPEAESSKGEQNMVADPMMHLRVIKAMDLLIGVVTLPLDNAPGSKRRRTKYGKAGCFRPTPYGVEYRTPSCWWIKSPVTVSLVYALGRMAWSLTAKGLDEEFYRLVKTDDDEIQGIINESDINASNDLWKRMRPYLGTMFSCVYNPLNISSMARGDKKGVHLIGLISSDAGIQARLDHYFRQLRKHSQGNYTIVHGLALVDYLRQGADETLIDKDVRKEWGFPEKIEESEVDRISGGIDRGGLMQKLGKELVGSKDFAKFQVSLMNELGCAHSYL